MNDCVGFRELKLLLQVSVQGVYNKLVKNGCLELLVRIDCIARFEF